MHYKIPFTNGNLKLNCLEIFKMTIKNFYELGQEKIIGETEFFILIYDGFPVSPGHILIVSKEIRKDYFDLTLDEKKDLDNAILSAKRIIEKSFAPNGYNIGMNCGESAGQTVFHFHCHIIPRYNGDMKDPRGGVRHCIEGKGAY